MIFMGGLLSSVIVPAAALWRLARDRRAKAVAVLVVALCYLALNVLAVLRLSGVLPAIHEPMPIMATPGSMAIALVVINVIISCCVLWRMRPHLFIALVVIGFVLAGCMLSLFTSLSPITTLFDLCCRFMAFVAYVLGLTYEEFCVIGNNYIQGALVVASALWLAAESWRSVRRESSPAGWTSLIMSGALSLGYGAMFYNIVAAYLPPLRVAFDRTVDDLYDLAALWHTTYFHVNIIIYVLAFVAAIGCNAACVWLLRKRAKWLCVTLEAVHLLAMAATAHAWPSLQ